MNASASRAPAGTGRRASPLTSPMAVPLAALHTLLGPRWQALAPRERRGLLLAGSAEFRAVWARHEVGIRPREVKHFVHPELGAMELTCQTLLDPQQSQMLLVYTAVPGSETHEKLQLLSVIGTQVLTDPDAGRDQPVPDSPSGRTAR